jgi:hypothetical protein
MGRDIACCGCQLPAGAAPGAAARHPPHRTQRRQRGHGQGKAVRTSPCSDSLSHPASGSAGGIAGWVFGTLIPGRLGPLARQHGIPLIALNVDSEAMAKVTTGQGPDGIIDLSHEPPHERGHCEAMDRSSAVVPGQSGPLSLSIEIEATYQPLPPEWPTSIAPLTSRTIIPIEQSLPTPNLGLNVRMFESPHRCGSRAWRAWTRRSGASTWPTPRDSYSR